MTKRGGATYKTTACPKIRRIQMCEVVGRQSAPSLRAMLKPSTTASKRFSLVQCHLPLPKVYRTWILPVIFLTGLCGDYIGSERAKLSCGDDDRLCLGKVTKLIKTSSQDDQGDKRISGLHDAQVVALPL